MVHLSPPCAPGLAHKTKHEMTKHLALFASLGRLTLSLHISLRDGRGWVGHLNQERRLPQHSATEFCRYHVLIREEKRRYISSIMF